METQNFWDPSFLKTIHCSVAKKFFMTKNFLDLKFFWTKNIYEIFRTLNLSMSKLLFEQNFFLTIDFWSQNFSASKILPGLKFFSRLKILWDPKFFWTGNFFLLIMNSISVTTNRNCSSFLTLPLHIKSYHTWNKLLLGTRVWPCSA